MTQQIDDALEQTGGALNVAAVALHRVGLDFADPYAPVAASQIASAARVIVGQLSQEMDDRLAAQTVSDVMTLLWPDADPEDCGQADWWRSPLGRLCARSLSRDDRKSVSHSVAAAMLGLARGTIGTMVSRGQLDRHTDGGVLRRSVLTRLARTP